jgi:hypothetical protein
MDVIELLERQGYASTYAGEWIVLSGPTIAGKSELGTQKLEFHGKAQDDAMKVIRLMWTIAPNLWTVAIKVPEPRGRKRVRARAKREI